MLLKLPGFKLIDATFKYCTCSILFRLCGDNIQILHLQYYLDWLCPKDFQILLLKLLLRSFMWKRHSDIALTVLLKLFMSRRYSVIALADAIKIIYVQTAFSCCTFSPMELLMTNSMHAVLKKDTCLIKHHMYFKCLIKYVCNIFFFHL